MSAVVMITGAASGIGQAICERLINRGLAEKVDGR